MSATSLNKIKHVVVLMFENRSFDHMCGWFGCGDGLGPGTFNLEDPLDASSPAVPANRDAAYVGDLTGRLRSNPPFRFDPACLPS